MDGRRSTAATLLVGAWLAAAALAGGYVESTYSLLAAGLLLALAAIAALAPGPRPSAGAALLGAFVAWTLVSAVWGAPAAALAAAPLAALYAAALLLGEWADRTLLLRGLWGGATAVSAVALAGRALGVGDGRLDWPVTYANGLGLVAVTGVLLSFLPGLPRRAAVAAGAVSCLAAALTLSRSALLAGLATLALLAWLRGAVPRKAALPAVAVPAAAAVAFAQPLAARFAAPAADEGDARRLLDVSGHGRAELWRTAWEQGIERPVTGGGAGTWQRAHAERTGSALGPADAHSLYLEAFAELGAPGVVLLVAVVALALAAGARRRAEGWPPVAAAVVAAWALQAAADWTWELPAATLPAIAAAGTLLARDGPPLRPPRDLALAAAALVAGVAAALHGIGAALVETAPVSEERAALAARLLPWDARPWVAVAASDETRRDAALARACAIDPGEPAIAREIPLPGESVTGCKR
ncbi:MAG TPA: O-antigen ligase family protein [Gaiellaceae bacterium]|nr:O-antigen ligase family protein [Gaiellaceae bacterium]